MEQYPGTVVLVVGPSGAGKDSIIRGAQAVFADDPDIVFPRRVVTRKADAAAEDHDTVSDMGFALAIANGEYAICWQAHGNGYALPRSIESDLAAGRTVIFNCSREAISDVRARYPHVVIADIQVSSSVLVERIVARGRETRQQAEERVARKVAGFPPDADVRAIRNDGQLANAIAAFSALVRSLDHTRPDPGRHPLHDQHKQEDGDDRGRRLVVVEHLQ